MTFYVRLSHFTGPFELLCHLIDQHEIDIYDIPIAQITEEYLRHLEGLEELDLDDASRFLLLAAQLLRIKSRWLLPGSREEDAGDEEDPREELVQKLEEYRRFQWAADYLEGLARQQGIVFTRPPFEPSDWFQDEGELEELPVEELVRAFSRVLEQSREEDLPVAPGPRRFSVEMAGEELWQELTRFPGGLTFQEIFPASVPRAAVAASFLALLELWYRGWVEVQQTLPLGEIVVRAVMEQ